MATIELPNTYMEIQWTDKEDCNNLMRGYRENLKQRATDLEKQGIKVTWFQLDKDNLELLKERAERQ